MVKGWIIWLITYISVHFDSNSSFKDLLKKGWHVSCSPRDIQSLAKELTKVKDNLPSTIKSDILQTRTQTCNWRLQRDFVRSCVNTGRLKLNSGCCFVPKVCNVVPLDLKNANNLHIFEHELRIRRIKEPKEFQRNLCQRYVSNLGFVNLV